MTGIPVRVELDQTTFVELERLATDKGVTMRELIAGGLRASVLAAQQRAALAAATPGRRHRTRLPDSDRAEIARLHAAGYTGDEIAQRVGCHRRTVENWRRAEREGKHQRTPNLPDRSR